MTPLVPTPPNSQTPLSLQKRISHTLYEVVDIVDALSPILEALYDLKTNSFDGAWFGQYIVYAEKRLKRGLTYHYYNMGVNAKNFNFVFSEHRIPAVIYVLLAPALKSRELSIEELDDYLPSNVITAIRDWMDLDCFKHTDLNSQGNRIGYTLFLMSKMVPKYSFAWAIAMELLINCDMAFYNEDEEEMDLIMVVLYPIFRRILIIYTLGNPLLNEMDKELRADTIVSK